ncbi:MAG: ABC transporter ATP-binding protein [Pyrinomonadaceae bacterium]
MMDVVLETLGLAKKYRGRVVVDDLSLTVERGDIFGFLGQNGAGKSTTLRMILGLVRPTRGRVLLLGSDISRNLLRALKRVGAIIEAPAFYDNLSGRQNLRMFAELSGGVKSGQLEAALETVDLRDRAGDPVRIYSHGMRQRLGIAQALLPDPEFIILDEPTDGLDPQGIHEMRLLIRRLRDERGLTIMLSSHLLYEVEQICNRIAIINEGRLLYQGEIEKLIAKDKTIKLIVDRAEEAYKLLSNQTALTVNHNGGQTLYLQMAEEQVPTINALLVERGFRVMELTPQRETLEQVFLRLTNKRVSETRPTA